MTARTPFLAGGAILDADSAAGRQRSAADPTASTWLSANAGSGKTRVLTDRVARLLLSGVDPQTILCLTYTKAAAAEMQARLFRRLGQWSMTADAPLGRELTDLGLTEGIDPVSLQEARRLFAQALETPGGLKIQTIHAFCAGLLRRFPLEAGVSPQFAELDDRAATLLRARVAEEMAESADAGLVDSLARHLSSDKFDVILKEIASRRDAFAEGADEERLRAMLGLPSHVCEESLLACLASPTCREELTALAALCETGGTTDQKAALRLRIVCARNAFSLDCLSHLEDVFLTGETAKEPFRAKIGSFPTKALQARGAEILEVIEPLMRAIEAQRDHRLALLSLQRATTLHGFAGAFTQRYEAAKKARGLLDFDDLIAHARSLLTDPSVAAWVLYRLDGGIDHILVDEAQDTSPSQWAVIERLAEEFSAGEGTEPQRHRTIFVVGDRKQSIFSFQGADAEGFEAMRRHFGERLERVGQKLEERALEHSFRSAQAVLHVVDHTFAAPHNDGLGEVPPRHMAFHVGKPGRVDLWPAIPKPPKDETPAPPWTNPVDREDPEHETLILANTIAASVAEMVEGGSLPVRVERDGSVAWARRAVTPGDVLILVQRRSRLFGSIIRALKAKGLDVAGADRLKVGAEMAVRDVLALLKFLALPEDSLSLACALKSPLFGWGEAQLYALAQPRPDGASLWEALRHGPDCEAFDILSDLRSRADFLRPYELISRILVRHDGRRRLLARLGAEAEDGIDALLSQAMAYESDAVPSLTGFLEWQGSGEVEIKRQMDTGSDRIRVMTVHGAKGLEAPIVILPDTHKRGASTLSSLTPVTMAANEGNGLLWAGLKADRPSAIIRAQADLQAAQERERRRLLYVAMTRAESWLIVCAAGETGDAGASWHSTIRDGLGRAGAVEHPFGPGPGLRYDDGGWDHLPALDAAPAASIPARSALTLPASPAPSARPAAPLSPSDLGGAKVLAGEEPALEDERDAALARGRLLHRALELLPGTPPDRVLSLLQAAEEAPLAGDVDAILAQALGLVDAPSLASVFGRPMPGKTILTEAAISADLPGIGRLHGAIDRLIVEPDVVTAVDFKSNRVVPATPEAVPEGILRQMGAYAAMLTAIYPDRPAHTAILWTATATLMPLPPSLVMAALRRAQDDLGTSIPAP